MKMSVSLPDEDVAFLDEYAQKQGYPSRSAALHKAVLLLRAGDLAQAYEEAWDSWEESGEAELWDSLIADGLEK